MFRFIDGPPFRSGSGLHYGHALIANLKDTIIRHKISNGEIVQQKVGNDCHGLPIEMYVTKNFGLDGKVDLQEFNKKCKETIMSFSEPWEKTYDALGRLYDKETQYFTMDIDFMETVWWTFKQLWDNNNVYTGYKIGPYSTACKTQISNFEASDNYKDIHTHTLYVKFVSKNNPKDIFIAWTTTPWTLPANLTLCVNPEIDYCKVHDLEKDCNYIIAKSRYGKLFKDSKKFPIVEEFKGKCLENIEYVPLFNYFKNRTFNVICDNFVTDITGTGVVHIAPAFGEEDFEVCLKNGIIKNEEVMDFCPIDSEGNYTSVVEDFCFENVLNVDKKITKFLKTSKQIFFEEDIVHSYPHCGRSGLPLIRKAEPGIYINVTSSKDKIIANNEKVNWVQEEMKNRFSMWLKDLKDWNVGRNRCFGTPIPIWTNGEESVCIGSIKELMCEANLEVRPTDIHPEYIKNITIPSKTGKNDLKLVPYVFDCWFESGVVPMGQHHYPFENSNIFDDQDYLCDLVCEGQDQTRGWFYTLSVISTLIFDKPPFKNVICTGLVLASDGKKFSKRDNNFIPIEEIINTYSSDALRIYLISSVASNGQSFKMSNREIDSIHKELHIYYNCVNFLEDYTNVFNRKSVFDPNFYINSDNIFDKWILSKVSSLKQEIDKNMNNFIFTKFRNIIRDFIENIANWYLAFNRFRLKNTNVFVQHCALSTLFQALKNSCKILSPFMPFMTNKILEKINKICKNEDENIFEKDENIERIIGNLQSVSDAVRFLRSASKGAQSVKFPLMNTYIYHDDPKFFKDLKYVEDYFLKELNSFTVKNFNINEVCTLKAAPNFKSLGKYKSSTKEIANYIKNLSHDDLKNKNFMSYKNFTLSEEDMEISYKFNTEYKHPFYGVVRENMAVVIDTEKTESNLKIYKKRLFLTEVQKMRKSMKLKSFNKIIIGYCSDKEMTSIIKDFQEELCSQINCEFNNLEVEISTFYKKITLENHEIMIWFF